jgi:hypothetical protein
LLAILGALLTARRKVPRLLWIPYYFCPSNLAAAPAVLTLAGGTRFEMWSLHRIGVVARHSPRGTIA